MNIVKKIFYFTYLINIKRNDKDLSLYTGFGMVAVVFLFNHFAPVTRILNHYFPPSFWDETDKIIKVLFGLYMLITGYLSYFKKDMFKMVEVVKDYSPWKPPIVGGFIYIVVSFLVAVIILFLT